MKDFYYILGVKSESSQEEIRQAYRKLSIKFHPDKNDGDDFFKERFQDIQEAFDVLNDSFKRKKYDLDRKSSTHFEADKTAMNFQPFIEIFNCNKKTFEYGEEVIFSWKTINADKVTLKPFGTVQPIGEAKYKLKNFKNQLLSFGLIAENSNISKMVEANLTLENKTYQELYLHFKIKIEQERALEQRNKERKIIENQMHPIIKSKVQELFTFLIIIIIIAIVIYQAWKSNL